MPLIAGSESLLVDSRLTPVKALQRKWVVDGYLAFIARQASAGDREFGDTSRLWQALVAVDAINGQGVQRAIQDAAVRSAGGVTGLAELARKAQDLKNEIDTLYAILGLAVGEDGQHIPGAIADIRLRLAAAQGELKDANARIDRGFPAYRDLLRPKAPTPREVQNALRPGETALVAYAGPDATYVWAIPQQGRIAFHVAPLGRGAIDARVQKLRRALDPNAFGIRTAIPEFDLATAHELHAALIKPVEATLGTSRHVLVIAHGPLAQVPFALLPTEAMSVRSDPEVAFAEYKPVRWLLRRHAMTQLPSLASLVTLRAQPAGNPNRQSFAGFGDPIFDKAAAPRPEQAATTLRGLRVATRSFSRGMALDSSELAQLPRLPDTADEIRGIATSLKANLDHDIFLGASANEKEVKTRDLSNRKVIAFATHGLIPGELNGLTQPALALSAPDVAGIDGDGLLTLEEVLGLKLDADWVVLSACNTAAGEGAGAEAITGLGRAFFYAGTRALLVSNWPVETVSARLITTGIFARQAADATLTRAEALRRTMLDLIDNGTARDAAGKPVYSYSHPLFWAPFSLIGDGG
jgi:CHAT domain-containing protein